MTTGISYFFSSFKKECSIDCNTESRILKSIAVQILLTEKPSINLSANNIIKALTIKRNSPKVTMVMGNVKITKTGFTKRFSTDSTTATISAVI